jgi:ferredoxin
LRVWIEQAYCIGSGLCELIAPPVFGLGDDGLAGIKQPDGQVSPLSADTAAVVREDGEGDVRHAYQSCPGGCIRLAE